MRHLRKIKTVQKSISLIITQTSGNSKRPVHFEVFEKLTRACYIEIALETMLLPILIDFSTVLIFAQMAHYAIALY